MSILKNGYKHPNNPPLPESPLVSSGYANSLRNKFLQESMHLILEKTRHRNGQGSIFSGFLQLPLLSFQAKQQVVPILRPQVSQKFLKVQTFRIETGEWVFFHIPISHTPRKYLKISFTVKIRSFNSRLYISTSTQLPWSSPLW